MEQTKHPDLADRQSRLFPALGLAVILAASAVAAAEVGAFSLFGHADDAEVIGKLIAESAARKDCPISIAQFGPGERWRQHHIVYQCVRAARETPAHLMSYPVAQ